MVKLCKYVGCTKQPVFGEDGSKIAEYCKTHAPVEFVDVKHKRCKHTGCKTIPTFGKDGTKIAEYCKIHAPIQYVNVKDKHCEHVGCKTRPSFGKDGSKIAEYCKTHAPIKYVDIRHKHCKYLGCKIRPNFGKDGSKIAEYCKTHAPIQYVNVKDKRCKHIGCTKQPYFVKDGTKIAEYCKTHAPIKYVNVKDKRCKHIGCGKHPVFGKDGSKIAEYCKTHAPIKYVNVKVKFCKHTGCKTRPNFGKDGSKIAEYCKTHAPIKYVNVKDKRCKYTGCGKQPNFGWLGYQSEVCAEHKEKGMIFRPKKRCKNCKRFATFVSSRSRYYCEVHKHKNSKEIQNICSICCCVTISKDQHTCSACDKLILLPHKKRDEIIIKEMLTEYGYNIIHDKIIVGGCSKKRPDFIISNKTGIPIIIEVDENQHLRSGYSCECEITRMKQIYFDYGAPFMIFIRYNPDKYKPLDGTSMLSATKRMNYLAKTINKHFQRKKIKKAIKVIYLFYDGFVRTDIETDYINPYE